MLRDHFRLTALSYLLLAVLTLILTFYLFDLLLRALFLCDSFYFVTFFFARHLTFFSQTAFGPFLSLWRASNDVDC